MQAIKELEFGELEEPLREYLDQVRTKYILTVLQEHFHRLGPGWFAFQPARSWHEALPPSFLVYSDRRHPGQIFYWNMPFRSRQLPRPILFVLRRALFLLSYSVLFLLGLFPTVGNQR